MGTQPETSSPASIALTPSQVRLRGLAVLLYVAVLCWGGIFVFFWFEGAGWSRLGGVAAFIGLLHVPQGFGELLSGVPWEKRLAWIR